MADFRISQGARRPSLRSTLLSAGKPVSLTNATVRFVMWTTNGHVVEGDAVIESAVNAQVRFDWPLNSTNIPGTYQAEWRIKYADDQVLAVPSDRFTHVRITGTNLAVATDSGAGTVAEAIAAAVEEHEAKNPAHDADKVSLSAAGVTANRVGAGFVEIAAALAGLDAGDVGAEPAGAVATHEAADPAHDADRIFLDVEGLDATRVGAGLVELAASIAGLDAGDVGAEPAGTVATHVTADPAHDAALVSLDVAALTATRVAAGLVELHTNRVAVVRGASEVLGSGSFGLQIGQNAGFANTANLQVAIGTEAGRSNTGSSQTAIGVNAGRDNTGGNQVAFGVEAGNRNDANNQNVFGSYAGRDNTGSSQTAFGFTAGINNTGGNQTVIGFECGMNNTGVRQSAVGSNAGRDNTGSEQVAIGVNAGRGNTRNFRLTIHASSSGTASLTAGLVDGRFISGTDPDAFAYDKGLVVRGSLETYDELILRSPDGSRWALTVDDTGDLSVAAATTRMFPD